MRIFLIMATVSCIVIIFLISIILPTFSASFYMNEYEKYDLSGTIGVSSQDLYAVTKNLQRYMMGTDKYLDVEVSVNGVVRPFFNEKEIFHMEDVKGLFNVGFMILWVFAFIFILAVAVIIKNKYIYEAARHMTIGVSVFLGAFGVLAAVVAVNFDRAFVVFHEIFFTNDLWLLDPETDLLINILPLEFFIDIAVFIGVVLLTLILIAMIAATIIRLFLDVPETRARPRRKRKAKTA